MKVKVVVLGSPSLMVLMVCVDVKQHCVEVVRRGGWLGCRKWLNYHREKLRRLYGSGSGRPESRCVKYIKGGLQQTCQSVEPFQKQRWGNF